MDALYGHTDDARLGDLFAASAGREAEASVALVLFPHDEGVRRNGGRVGAARGPAQFMQMAQRTGALLNREHEADIRQLWVALHSDVGAGLSLEDAHDALTTAVQKALSRSQLPFVVGGGNDQSYPNARALLAHAAALHRPVAVINIDAHLDVRPLKEGKVHSGSPFRQLLEDERFKPSRFVEFAAQGMQCSAVHADWLVQRGGRIVWLDAVKKMGARAAFQSILSKFVQDDPNVLIFVSFDLDAVRSADAPGVSCPGALGLSSDDALEICFDAGNNPNVALFDLSEFNPEIEGYRTGKLVAAMFYHFLMGKSKRK